MFSLNPMLRSRFGILKLALSGISFLFSDAVFAQPVINSFSPSLGPIGTIVTINGSNFSVTPANNIVYFGAVKASVTTATSNSLSVVVPLGATFQPITVTTNNHTAFSARPFIVTFPGGGAITSSSFEDKIDINVEESPYDIANGDLDGDGKIDIVAVNGGYPYSFSLFRNTSTTGSISFAPKIDYPTGIVPFSVAISDIDGDGKKDVIVANESSFSISIFRNTSSVGNISFDVRVDLPAAVPTKLAIADLDKDGRPDIVSSNFVSSSVSLFKNTGTIGAISFAPRIDLPTGAFPTSVAIGDLDGDASPDLTITSSDWNTIWVYKNNGLAGTVSFSYYQQIATAAGPSDIQLVDIDGDGKLDMNVSDDAVLSIYRNTGTIGTISFESPVHFSNGLNYATALNVADLDGDGKPDLSMIVAEDSVAMMRNSSTGSLLSFDPPAVFLIGRAAYNISAADLDGDSRPDLATINQSTNNISILRNKVNGPNITGFGPVAAPQGATVIITGTNFTGVSAVSFGGVPAQSFTIISPTTISAVVGIGATGEVTVIAPLGTARRNGFTLLYYPQINSFSPLSGTIGTIVTIKGKGFSTATSVKFGGTSAMSFSILSDTTITALVNSGSSGDVSVTSSIGNAFLAGFIYLSPAIPRITSISPLSGPVGTTVTINGINFNASTSGNTVYFGPVKANVLTASESELTVAVPVGATYEPIRVTSNTLVATSSKPFSVTFPGGPAFTAGTFTDPITFGIFSGTASNIKNGDFDGDGKFDFVYANHFLDYISVLRNTSIPNSFSLVEALNFMTNWDPFNVGIGDIDGDSKLDIIVAATTGNAFSVLRNTSTPSNISFAPKIDIPSLSNSQQWVVVTDLDMDGKQDVVIANSGYDILEIFRNTTVGGVISFAPVVQIQAADGPVFIVAGDIDDDGKPDLVTANQNSGSMSVFRNLSTPGSIQLAPKIDNFSGTFADGVQVGDLDGDGKIDVAVANGYTKSVSVFRNTTIGSNITFAAKINLVFDTQYGPPFLSIGDLNGDAKPEIVAVDSYHHNTRVFKNRSIPGTINFADMVAYGAGHISLLISDMDGDGKMDLINGRNGGFAILGNTIGKAKTTPSGPNPVTGDIISRVTVDPFVQTYNGSPYVQRHYDIEPAQNPSTSTATITLYFTQEEFNNYNAFPTHGADLPTGPLDTNKRANIRIFQYHGFSATSIPGSYSGAGVQIDPVDSSIVWNPLADCWEIKFEVNGFSGFFIASAGNSILPLKLVYFKGIYSGNKTKLNWVTTNEVNVDHFDVERSYDGRSFSRIDEVRANGSGIGNQFYYYDDELNILSIVYYRLKIVDKDNHFEYSPIVKIAVSNDAENIIRISPNPAKQFITINHPLSTEKTNLKVINFVGQIMKISEISRNSQQTIIDIKGLPRGLYTLIWSDGKAKLSQTFMVE